MNNLLRYIKEIKNLCEDLKHEISCVILRLKSFEEEIENINFGEKDYLTPVNQGKIIGNYQKKSLTPEYLFELKESINNRLNYIEIKNKNEKYISEITSKIMSLNNEIIELYKKASEKDV